MIPSWSYSKLGDFEKCKFLCWLKHDQKIPEPERPLPAGKTEHANERGSRVHDAAERYVNGTGPFINELRKFNDPLSDFPDHFDKLKRLFALGKVELEGEWGMDREWETTEWKGAWLRLKLDALVHNGKYKAVVIDYKTGKKYGNEIKHAQQLQLYALVTFLRYPYLDEVTSELWYLDVGEITTQTFTRDQALRFKRSFDKRGSDLTSCDVWPANPNKYSCKWCAYGPAGTGDCSIGV